MHKFYLAFNFNEPFATVGCGMCFSAQTGLAIDKAEMERA